jgi:hypothetical protein
MTAGGSQEVKELTSYTGHGRIPRTPKKVWGEQRLGVILTFVRDVAQAAIQHRRQEVG